MLREPGGRPGRRCVPPGSRPAFRSDPRSGGDRASHAADRCLRHRPGGSRWRLLAGQRGEGRLVSAPARRHIEDIPDRPDRVDVTEIFASLAEREHQLGRPVHREVTPTSPQTRGAERPRPLPALLGHARHARASAPPRRMPIAQRTSLSAVVAGASLAVTSASARRLRPHGHGPRPSPTLLSSRTPFGCAGGAASRRPAGYAHDRNKSGAVDRRPRILHARSKVSCAAFALALRAGLPAGIPPGGHR